MRKVGRNEEKKRKKWSKRRLKICVEEKGGDEEKIGAILGGTR